MKKITDPGDAQAWPKSASVTENSLVELRNQFTGDQKSMKSCEEREPRHLCRFLLVHYLYGPQLRPAEL